MDEKANDHPAESSTPSAEPSMPSTTPDSTSSEPSSTPPDSESSPTSTPPSTPEPATPPPPPPSSETPKPMGEEPSKPAAASEEKPADKPEEKSEEKPEEAEAEIKPVKPFKPAGGTRRIVMIIVFLLVVGLTAGAIYMMNQQNKQAKADEAALKSQVSSLQATTHDLPADAVKVSDCIPNMGSHYLPKDSDPEYGPFMLVTKQNKVIGIEYMASSNMYTNIPGVNPPVEILEKNSPMLGWKFDHLEFSHLPKGHEGLLRDHIDVHMYTVGTDQVKNACV